MTGVHTRCARTAQGYWFAATVFDAALSRSKQATEYLQHPPIGSLSFGRGVVRGLLDQDQKIASKLAPTGALESITYFVFDMSCRGTKAANFYG
ncbi:MAG TPA: hypothetical protein DIT33_18160 [Pseudomonas sp.]|nr:hypothetical protein [Pseudomonas sp.]